MLNYFFFVPVFCMRMYCCYEYVVGHLKQLAFLWSALGVENLRGKCLQVHATSSLSVHQHNTIFLTFLKSGQRTEKTFSVQQGKFHHPTKIDPSVFSSHIPQSPWTVRSQPLEAAACAKKIVMMSGEAWLYLLSVLINAVNLFLQVFFTIMYSDLEWWAVFYCASHLRLTPSLVLYP